MSTETLPPTEPPRTAPATVQVSTAQPAAPDPAPPSARPRSRRRWIILGLVLVGLIVGAFFLFPVVRTAMTTVSTDDAYVNAHVTFVAPRIGETVASVLVDDNDYVKKGDLLVMLDKEVERIRVEQAEAALNVARRAEAQEVAKSRALAALAKANHFKLVSAMTDIRNQAAALATAVARLDEARAAEKLARTEVQRFVEAGRRGAETPENVDIRRSEYVQAQARARQAEEEVRRMRVALEVPADPPPGKPLTDVPADQDQRHSSVIAALSTFAQNLADLGLDLPRYSEPPDAYIKRIHALAPNGDLDLLIERTATNAPSVESARAQVKRAETDLSRAKLDLSYCEIRADIDGFVSNRNVNPGNRVDVGQRLMAIRSDREIWIDCNFKETQLDPIRIGHPVDVYIDAYPNKVFHGRVTGFNPGTGQSLALLPPQNATGNFVKIVQRLPVRVELNDGNPPDTPLFVGLSATPYVLIREHPTGPDAGQRLRGPFAVTSRSSPGSTPAPESRSTRPPGDVRIAPARSPSGR